MVEFCKSITTSRWFSQTILILIVFSGILVGMETYPPFSEGRYWGEVLQVTQKLILGVFVVEILMKIVACGSRPWKYFGESWNLFDFTVVAVCLLPLNMHSAAVIRLARILRALRMITVLPRLRLLVSALLRAIPSLGYIGVLLGLHFYIYSVIGTVTFGKNDPVRFGNLHRTAATLFQVLTLEGWNDVRDTQVMGSDVTYDEQWKTLTQGTRYSLSQPIAATVYFVSFILLGTMIMLNLFTGVIISSMEEAQHETDDQHRGENRDEQLRGQGFLTLNDELGLVASQLQQITQQMNSLQSQLAALESSKVAVASPANNEATI